MHRPSRPQPSRNSTFAPCTCGAAIGICLRGVSFVLEPRRAAAGRRARTASARRACCAVWPGCCRRSPARSSGADDSCTSCRDDYHQQLAYLAHINALKADLTALENLHYGVALAPASACSRSCATCSQRLQHRSMRRSAGARAVGRAEATRRHRPHPADATRRCGFSMSRSRISMRPASRCSKSAWRSTCATGGLILTAAHQLLLQGRAGRANAGAALMQSSGLGRARSAGGRARSAARGPALGPGDAAADLLRDRHDAVSAGDQPGAG